VSLLRIGLIADTHGLLRPEALEAMGGCDRIIHAGDVGDIEVLEALRQWAPVDAICGSIDRGSWADLLPEHLDLVPGGCRIHELHDFKEWVAGVGDTGPQVVVSGHSHAPSMQHRDAMLIINPGSARPRCFKLPVSAVACRRLHRSGGRTKGGATAFMAGASASL